MMDFQRARTVFWGNVHAQADADRSGNQISVSALHAADPGKVARRAGQRLQDFLSHASIEEDQVAQRLEEDDYLVGYVAGIAAAAAREAGIGNEVDVMGITTRVLGELLGGGLDNKIHAHQRAFAAMDHTQYLDGHADGVKDWESGKAET